MKNIKIKAMAIGALVIVGGLFTFPNVMEKVNAGQYKICQQLDGDLEVLARPGWQYTGFVSNITKYDEAGIYYFSDSDLDGGSGVESSAISVIFRDGSRGRINGNFQFKLPSGDATRIELHRLYGRNYEAIVHNLIRKTVAESILSSATYFKGEEAYSYGKSDFINLIKDQIEEGIFANVREEQITTDAEGNKFMDSFIKLKLDKNGQPIVNKKSKLKEFDVMNIGLNITDIELDEKTMQYIEKKKDAEFEKIQKKSEAEKAKQDAITAEELGKANVARAKYAAEVTKQTAVTNAEREKEVAELKASQDLNVAKLDRQKAEEIAKATLVRKEADAKANALLVKAGLTPLEKAEIEMKTKIGVARELAKAEMPRIIVGGSGANGVSPLDAVGIKFLMDIDNKLSK